MVQREPAEIEREIELTRVYLADTVDAIADRVSPKAVAGRTITKVKDTVHQLTSGGVETFTTQGANGADGTTYEVHRKLRVDRVAMAAGAVAGVVGLAVGLRRWRHH